MHHRSTESDLACTHRWRIAEQNGSRSLGTCRHCGAERIFANGNWTDLALSRRCGVAVP